jgi:hypothetical protein
MMAVMVAGDGLEDKSGVEGGGGAVVILCLPLKAVIIVCIPLDDIIVVSRLW